MNSIKFDDKHERFESEDGWHRVQCKRVFDTEDQKVRLIFSKLDQTSSVFDYVAGKTFVKSLTANSELKKSLLDWFGEDLSQFFDEDNQIDLQKLVGKRACIRTFNRYSEHHPRPFLNITDFAPIDSWTED